MASVSSAAWLRPAGRRPVDQPSADLGHVGGRPGIHSRRRHARAPCPTRFAVAVGQRVQRPLDPLRGRRRTTRPAPHRERLGGDEQQRLDGAGHLAHAIARSASTRPRPGGRHHPDRREHLLLLAHHLAALDHLQQGQERGRLRQPVEAGHRLVELEARGARGGSCGNGRGSGPQAPAAGAPTTRRSAAAAPAAARCGGQPPRVLAELHHRRLRPGRQRRRRVAEDRGASRLGALAQPAGRALEAAVLDQPRPTARPRPAPATARRPRRASPGNSSRTLISSSAAISTRNSLADSRSSSPFSYARST